MLWNLLYNILTFLQRDLDLFLKHPAQNGFNLLSVQVFNYTKGLDYSIVQVHKLNDQELRNTSIQTASTVLVKP